MTKTFDRLIDLANTNLDQAEECDSFDASNTYAQLAIPYALIAIAQELHQINNRADIKEERQELIQARKERLADLG